MLSTLNAFGGSSAFELLTLFRATSLSSASSSSAPSASSAQSASKAISAAEANDPIGAIKGILAGAQMEQRLPAASAGESASSAVVEAAYAAQTGSGYTLSFAGANDSSVWGGSEQSFVVETAAETPTGESAIAIAGVAFQASSFYGGDGNGSDSISFHSSVIAASLTTVSISQTANGATSSLVAAQMDAFYLSDSVGAQSAAIGFGVGGLGQPVAAPSRDWTDANAVVSVGQGDVTETFSIGVQNGDAASTTSLTIVGLNMAQAQHLEASFENATPTSANHDGVTETAAGADAYGAWFSTATSYFSGALVTFGAEIWTPEDQPSQA